MYPDDTNEVFGYDKNSNITSYRNRNWQTITYAYDALNRMTSKTRPGQSAITYTYDIAGRPKSVNNNGKVTEYYYDHIGRITDVNDPDKRLVSYEYDKRGLWTKLWYPDDSYVTYEYDPMARLKKIKYNGNMVAEYKYDELSRRTLVTLGNDANAVYTYNIGDRLTRLDNKISSTHLMFDYTYDKVGNRKTMEVDDAYTHNYTYDKIYRLMEADYPGSPFTDYYYDSLGNRTSVNESGTETDYTQNNEGLNQYGSVGGTSYAYDDNGNLTNDGTYKYYYDCENRLTGANEQNNQQSASYEYDYLGRRIKRTSGEWVSPTGCNDPENCWNFDLNAYDGNLTTRAWVGWFGYELGAESGPLELTHAGVNCSKIRYKAGTCNAYIQIWVYYNDDWHIIHDGYVPEPSNDPYHYIELDGTYLVTGIKFVVVCDTDEGSYGEVSEAEFCESQGGDYKRYVYDGEQIIAEYNSSGTLLRKYVYGPGIDEPVAMITASGTKYYYHFDGLGSVIALSNASHNIVEQYSYDVFGEPNRVSAVGNPYMFTGRAYDPNTGLYDYRARVYKPQIGRFLQTDPVMQFMQIASVQRLSEHDIPGKYLSPMGMRKYLRTDPIGKFLKVHPAGRFLQAYQYGFPVELNLYTYCSNNPLNWIDPWGLCKGTLASEKVAWAAWSLVGSGIGLMWGSGMIAEFCPQAGMAVFCVGAGVVGVGAVAAFTSVGMAFFGY